MQAGAHIYVCGDARHMAGDVHCILLEVLSEHGGMDMMESTTYMVNLETKARYQRDVWVS